MNAIDSQAAVQAFIGKPLNRTLYAVNTALLPVGEERARARRLAWEARPALGPGLDDVIGKVRAEERQDVAVKLADLRVDSLGRLDCGDRTLGLSPVAYRQLASEAPADAFGPNLNSWMRQSARERILRTRMVDYATAPDYAVDGAGKVREAFGAVSSRYKAFDLDRVAAEIRPHLPADAHVDAIVGPKWQLDVSFANPAMLDEARVGMAHRIVVRLRGADDGTGSLRIQHYAERVRCVNCTLVADKSLRAALRHTADLSEALALAVAKSGEALESFGALWREANVQRIHDRYDGSPLGAEQVFQRLVAHGYVKLPGAPADQVAALMSAWSYEPGDTAGVVNMAVTRAAQDSSSESARTEIEEQAGELLYARVYNLPGLTEEQAARF